MSTTQRSRLDQARRLLDEAVDGYGRYGMPRHRQLAEAALAAL